MKGLYFIQFLFLFTSVSTDRSRVLKHLYQHWQDVTFKAGDFLWCKRFLAPDEVFLATSGTKVAHITNIHNETGQLREESWRDYHRNQSEVEGPAVCRHVVPSGAFGVPLPLELILARAQADLQALNGTRTYHSLTDCNSAHWVRSWIYGAGLIDHELNSMSPKCLVNKLGGKYDSIGVYVYAHAFWPLTVLGANFELAVYRDQCLSFDEDHAPTNRLAAFDDSLTKITFKRSGDCLKLWKDHNCLGESVCVCESKYNLQFLKTVDGGNWNNEVSSVSFCNY